MSSFPDQDFPREEALALGPTLELVRALCMLREAIDGTSRRVMERLGITDRERLALRLVGKFPGLTVDALGGLLGEEPERARALVARLRRHGLVSLRPDPRRARRTLVGLTASGRSIDVPSPAGLEAAAYRVLRSLSLSKREAALRLMEEVACSVRAQLASVTAAEPDEAPEPRPDERVVFGDDLDRSPAGPLGAS